MVCTKFLQGLRESSVHITNSLGKDLVQRFQNELDKAPLSINGGRFTNKCPPASKYNLTPAVNTHVFF